MPANTASTHTKEEELKELIENDRTKFELENDKAFRTYNRKQKNYLTDWKTAAAITD
ncbi:MAG: hypothetical protein KIS71_02580 [Bacteroidetes bacterium]|nr:hypothetical protein [Bacteroidota bacterium]